MQVNLLLLMPLLTPSSPDTCDNLVPFNNFFLDDAIITYQLKLLWFGRNTMLVRALTSPGFAHKLVQVLEDYDSYTKAQPTFVSLRDYFSEFLGKHVSCKDMFDFIYMDILGKSQSMFAYHVLDPFSVFFESSLSASALSCESFDSPPTMRAFITRLPYSNTRDYITANWDLFAQKIFSASDYEDNVRETTKRQRVE
jgi:hypothetical protein